MPARVVAPQPKRYREFSLAFEHFRPTVRESVIVGMNTGAPGIWVHMNAIEHLLALPAGHHDGEAVTMRL